MNRIRLINSDVLAGLAMLPNESVQCCVTSPPYWGLRDYGVAGAYGLEPTIEEYVGRMVEVFREIRRVLRKDGVLFLNLGDSYNGSGGAGGDYGPGGRREGQPKYPGRNVGKSRGPRGGSPKQSNPDSIPKEGPNRFPIRGLKPKDLCGIPWRVALALQADGWWLRADIIWAKPNPMPESCTDRPTKAHEYIFLLTKSAHYFWDQEAVREEGSKNSHGGGQFHEGRYSAQSGRNDGGNENFANAKPAGQSGRNLRTVWEIATRPFPEAHFATYPPELVHRCVAAGTSERGCCPKCGAGWKRVVEKSGGTTGKDWNTHNRGEADLSIGATKSKATSDGSYRREFTGWSPACTCPHTEVDLVPCKVLDPFSGAGTTALVAAKLGRDAIGIELNPAYVEMSRKRIAGELAMLVEITLDTPGESRAGD